MRPLYIAYQVIHRVGDISPTLGYTVGMTNISNLFSLNWNDFIKGVIVAFLVALLGGLQQALTAHGVDFGSYDWGTILNLSLTAGVGYLAKNFLSSNTGAFLGVIGN